MMLLAALSARAEELPPPVALDGVGCGCPPAAHGGARSLPAGADSRHRGGHRGHRLHRRTRVRQRFQNPAGEWVEGVYVFPLPDAAAVDTLRLRVGERDDRRPDSRAPRRQADLRPGESGRQEGRAGRAGAAQHLHHLDRPAGPGRSRGGRARIQDELRFDQGTLHLRFPMVVGPRYFRGRGETRGAWVPAAGFGSAAECSGGRSVAPRTRRESRRRSSWPGGRGDDTAPIQSRSVERGSAEPVSRRPAAELLARHRRSRPAAGRIRVLGVPGSQANRDFALEWTPARGSEPHAVLFSEECGRVLLAARRSSRRPRPVDSASEPPGARGDLRPRHLGVDVRGLHRSGQGVLRLALDRLRPRTTYVIEFDSRARRLWPEPLPAYVEHVEEARRWVEGLEERTLAARRSRRAVARAGRPAEVAPPSEAADSSGRLRHRRLRRERGSDLPRDCAGLGEYTALHCRHRLGSQRAFPSPGSGRRPWELHLRRPAQEGVRPHRTVAQLENPVLADWRSSGTRPEPLRFPAGAGSLAPASRWSSSPSSPNLSGQTVLRTLGQEAWSDRVELDRAVAGKGIHAVWARRRIAELEDTALDGAGEDEIRAGIVEVRWPTVSYRGTPAWSPSMSRRRRLELHRLYATAGPSSRGMGRRGIRRATAGSTPARLYLACGLAMLVARHGWPGGAESARDPAGNSRWF